MNGEKLSVCPRNAALPFSLLWDRSKPLDTETQWKRQERRNSIVFSAFVMPQCLCISGLSGLLSSFALHAEYLQFYALIGS
jgi:hypothetical protein